MRTRADRRHAVLHRDTRAGVQRPAHRANHQRRRRQHHGGSGQSGERIYVRHVPVLPDTRHTVLHQRRSARRGRRAGALRQHTYRHGDTHNSGIRLLLDTRRIYLRLLRFSAQLAHQRRVGGHTLRVGQVAEQTSARTNLTNPAIEPKHKDNSGMT